MSNYTTINVCESGRSTLGEIAHNKCVKFDITLSENSLSGISLKFATFARINKCSIKLDIIDKAKKKVLYTRIMDCSYFIDCDWVDFYFPEITGVRELSITLTPLSSSVGNAVSLFFDPQKEGKIQVWNYNFKGAVCLKTHHAKDDEVRVTICCITYNHANFIREALDSFLAQKTNFKFQIFINDDGSTDATTEIIKNYEKKYPNIIKAFYNDYNISADESFLKILSKANSEYVALCEGDDFWISEKKLQKQVDFLDAYKDFAVCFHPVYIRDGHNPKNIDTFPNINTHKKVFEKPFTDLEDLIKGNFIQTNSVMYRWRFCNSDIKELFPINILPGDWYLHLLHAEVGKIGFINEIMAVYRKHDAGIWHGGVDKVIKKYGLQHANFFNKLATHFHPKFSSELKSSEIHLLEKYKNLNNNLKTISVIIPTYNQEKYIQKSIESVLNQKGSFNLEIVIGNDCSTDSTAEIIRAYRGVKIINHEINIGLLGNIKECFKACSGDYIALCEGDDYWTSPWRLQRMLEYLESKPSLAGCFTNIVMEKDGKFLKHEEQTKLPNKKKLSSSDMLTCNYPGNFSCCFYRTDILSKILSYTDNASDWVFNTLAAHLGGLGYLKEKSSVWRIHDKGSWSGKSKSEQEEIIIATREKIIKIIKSI